MQETVDSVCASKARRISTNAQTIIAAVGFLLIFGALLALASVFDLDISKKLTANSLDYGDYYSTNGFGLFFEAVGSAPIWIMSAIAAVIFFWNSARAKNKILRVLLGIGSAVLAVALFYMFFSDVFKYVLEKVDAKKYADELYVILLKVTISAFAAGSLIFAWRNVKTETNRTLLKWAIVIVCVAACYAVITLIKIPVGRVRFRTMNAMGDTGFRNFTGWWVVNGKRTVVGLPSDSCQSFPSGHTFAAGVIYTLICLPKLIPSLDKKWIKVAFYIVSVLYTGVVAVSRIVVGAHYLSDVLFGGSIAFLATVLFREIFIDKFVHFKDLFGCGKKQIKTENTETQNA